MTAEEQWKGFVEKFAPANRRLIRAIRKTLRQRLPTANELVWDNYNFLVLGYCPSLKASECLFSVGFDKNGATLFFGFNGKKIADPKKLLQGSGAANRFVRLESAKTLEQPEVWALVESAKAISKTPLLEQGKGELIIRMVSPKQRPRR